MKPNRQLPREAALEILAHGKYGVLSTASVGGVPYGVPVNYVYVPEDNALYFHCFLRGHKLENIRQNPCVSFVVVGREQIVEERFVTHYESALVCGQASLVTDEDVKREKLVRLCQTLAPSAIERRDEVIRKQWAAVTIVKIMIEDITGKRNQDL